MRRLLIALAATSGVLALATAQFSSAAFTAQTTQDARITSSSDWTPPTVSLATAAAGTGSVSVTATAADADSGVASVEVELRRAGETAWTSVCTRTSVPATCTVDTTALADGTYELRAVATDRLDNRAASEPRTLTVANRAAVSLAAPAAFVRGTVALSATVADAPAGATVRVERRAAGASAWTTTCAGLTAPYSCSWDTTTAPAGDHELRAVLVLDDAVLRESAVQRTTVDTVAPTVTTTVPTGTVSGRYPFSATAADATSGVATVTFQHHAGGTWRTLCTATAAPFTCVADTTAMADGQVLLRAVATDRAGNSATSDAVTATVLNATVTLADPGSRVGRSVPLEASVATTGTASSVTFQRRAAGATAWTTICVDTTAPYACTWDTTALADGSRHDLRAVLAVSGAGTVTSAVLADRVVDTVPVRGYDVQAVNTTGDAGRIDAGDVLTYTFTKQVDLATISAGWDGSPVAVDLRVSEVWGSIGTDTLTVRRDGREVALGPLVLGRNFVNGDGSATATMSATTTTVDGRTATVVRIVVTAASTNGGTLLPGDLRWTPDPAVKDVAGNPIDTATVVERGSWDRDF